MSDPDPEKLKQLEDRINAIKAANTEPSKSEDHFSMADVAWRMVIELTAGIGIGFGIGYGLDTLFGTIPIFMVLFLGLGLAAGIRVMMRTAMEVQEKQLAHVAKDEEG